MSKFERLKVPPAGTMPGVSFHASDKREAGSGPGVVLFGGNRPALSGELWYFEPTGDGWVQLFPAGAAPAPRTQSTFNVVSEDGRTLLLFAGFAMNVGEVNDVWTVEMPADSTETEVKWTQPECAGDPPPARYGHTTTSLGTQLVVIGGQDSKDQFNDVWLLALDGFAWSCPAVSGTPMLPRARHTATCVLDNDIIILGGFNREQRMMGDAFTLTLGAGEAEWNELNVDTPGEAMTARAQHAATASPDGRYIFIFGGYSGDGAKCFNDLWLLDVENSNMNVLPTVTPPEPRCRHTMHIMGEKLHIFSGFDASKPHNGDVFSVDVEDCAGLLKRSLEKTDKGKGDGEAANEEAED